MKGVNSEKRLAFRLPRRAATAVLLSSEKSEESITTRVWWYLQGYDDKAQGSKGCSGQQK